MFGLLALTAFKLGEYIGGNIETGRTLAFMVLALSQVVQAFNMRSGHSLFKIGPFTNKKLNLAVLASVLLMAFVLFVPGVQGAFGLVALSWEVYLIGLGLSLVPLIVMEVSKLFGAIRHH